MLKQLLTVSVVLAASITIASGLISAQRNERQSGTRLAAEAQSTCIDLFGFQHAVQVMPERIVTHLTEKRARLTEFRHRHRVFQQSGASEQLYKVTRETFNVILDASVLIAFSMFCFGAAIWREIFPAVPPPVPDAKRIPSAFLYFVNFCLAVVALFALASIWIVH